MSVKRAHTNANIAPAISILRVQVNEMFPHRSKKSDGIWPSATHTKANPNSDHEAGNAFDITADLGDGHKVQELVDILVAQKDSRLSYVIHNGHIWSRTYDFKKRTYTGSNPHKTHAHISVIEKKRGSSREWKLVEPISTTKTSEDKVYARVNVNTILRMRAKPSIAGKVLRKLADNTRVRVLSGGTSKWERIMHGDVKGYVAKKYLKREK